MQDQQHFWNGIALILFILFGALSVVVIARFGTTDFTELGFFDLTLLGLATFRLIHLLTYDKTFAAVRVSFMDGRGRTLRKAARGWRRLVCELLECLWCTGMWSGLFAVTVYCLGSWGRLAIIVLAVAGLGSLFQIISRALGEAS
jgi:hypothetical protein